MTPTDFAESGPLFVDTNVFLRFLTNDVPEQAAAVEALFRRAAAGEVRRADRMRGRCAHC